MLKQKKNKKTLTVSGGSPQCTPFIRMATPILLILIITMTRHWRGGGGGEGRHYSMNSYDTSIDEESTIETGINN